MGDHSVETSAAFSGSHGASASIDLGSCLILCLGSDHQTQICMFQNEIASPTSPKSTQDSEFPSVNVS